MLQSCPTLCDPIDGSPTGSLGPGILQARTLEWVAISFSNAWKWKVESESEVAQSCLTLSDPMDCSLPGSSIHGIFRATVLEWGAIAFSESPANPPVSENRRGLKFFCSLGMRENKIVVRKILRSELVCRCLRSSGPQLCAEQAGP